MKVVDAGCAVLYSSKAAAAPASKPGAVSSSSVPSGAAGVSQPHAAGGAPAGAGTGPGFSCAAGSPAPWRQALQTCGGLGVCGADGPCCSQRCLAPLLCHRRSAFTWLCGA